MRPELFGYADLFGSTRLHPQIVAATACIHNQRKTYKTDGKAGSFEGRSEALRAFALLPKNEALTV